MELFAQLLANGLVNGALYALMAVSFGLVFRSMKVFHIVWGGIFLLAPYACWLLAKGLHLPLTIAVLGGVLVAALGGACSEWALYRPMYRKHVSGGAVIVASLGAYIVLENVMALLFGDEVQTLDRGFSNSVSLGFVRLASIQIEQFFIAMTLILLTGYAVSRIRIFKALWAMGDEPGLIPVLGLPLMRLRLLALAISGALAGVVACLIFLDSGVDPHMGMHFLLIATVALLAGGIDRFSGWVAGGFLLALLQSLMLWKFPAQWMDLVTFGLLIVVLLFRPQGMFGIGRRLEEA